MCGQLECVLLLEDSEDKNAIKLEKKKKKKREKLLRLKHPRFRFRNVLTAITGLKSSFGCKAATLILLKGLNSCLDVGFDFMFLS